MVLGGRVLNHLTSVSQWKNLRDEKEKRENLLLGKVKEANNPSLYTRIKYRWQLKLFFCKICTNSHFA